MLFPNPKNEGEKKMNDMQFKFLLFLGIGTILFGIFMYPHVML